MVRPPTVMSPSGNPQLDSKFSNQGKPGGSASQSQPSPCDSKSGGHTPKALPGPGGSMGLKNGAGSGAKGKGKRERSISADSFDQRDPGTPNDDSDIKGMSIRSLRLGEAGVPWGRLLTFSGGQRLLSVKWERRWQVLDSHSVGETIASHFSPH